MNKDLYDRLIALDFGVAELVLDPDKFQVPAPMLEKLSKMREELKAMVEVGE